MKSLTVAAERLFVTQSAVSQSLAKLRATLQDELFIRTGGVMAATSFANAAYPQFREALALSNELSAESNRSTPAPRLEPFESLYLSWVKSDGWQISCLKFESSLHRLTSKWSAWRQNRLPNSYVKAKSI